MKFFNTDEFAVGNKVFFIENGKPHSAIIKELYENVAVLSHVTFLDKIFDTRTHDVEQETWEVRPDHLIKTDQFYFPYHPSIEMRIWVSQLMCNLTREYEMTCIRYGDFLKKYKKKVLHYEDTSLFFAYPENYIKFTKNTVMVLENEPGVIYRVKPILYPNKRMSYWLEKYSSNMEKPDVLVKANWNDYLRNPEFPGTFATLDEFIDKYENPNQLKIEIRDDINYSSIKYIYNITNVTLNHYFNGDIHKALKKKRGRTKGIEVNTKYFNLEYEK